jgi:ATP-binding cassette subfamily A (ABC1) protein 7
VSSNVSSNPGPTYSRFGAGHTLTLRVPADQPERTVDFVVAAFPGAELREVHGGRLRFQLPPGGRCALACVFGELAAHGSDHGIEDFSVSQTTLEEVTWDRHGTGGEAGTTPLSS